MCGRAVGSPRCAGIARTLGASVMKAIMRSTQRWVGREDARHWPPELRRSAEVSWLSTRARRGIAGRRSPRQWPLTGKFHVDTDRQLLAGPRQLRTDTGCRMKSSSGKRQECSGRGPLRPQAVVLFAPAAFRDNRPMDPSPGPWAFHAHVYGLANVLLDRDGRVISCNLPKGNGALIAKARDRTTPRA
jgi:hypothetical protein